jgi:galactose oxidase
VGQDRPLTLAAHPAVQDIEGAIDLDVLPTMNETTVTAGRIWCAAGTPVQVIATIDQTGWDNNARVDVTLVAPSGSRTTLTISLATAPGAKLQTRTTAEGFHSLDITASRLPAMNSIRAYKLSLTYSAPQTFTAPIPTIPEAAMGRWEPVFDLENVAIHAHLLPTGKVLYWGRRSGVGDTTFASLNEHFCSTFLLDLATPSPLSEPAAAQRPQLLGGGDANLFCSGHSFMPDGRLLVIGGHLFDSERVDQACIYDADAKTWTPQRRMNNGRWYPSALTLPDGSVLAISGSFAEGRRQPPPDEPLRPPFGTRFPTNPNPQLWRGNDWAPTQNFQTLQLYPRLHVEPRQGRVFMAGPQGQSYFLDVTGSGTWTPGPVRDGALRDYAPSVMYQSGKIIFIGGGQDGNTQLPTNMAETIDLNAADPQWKPTSAMHFPRRQHNATVLPDGTVLVTGGTQGIAGNPHWLGFNNLQPGAPVHQAELWDPTSGQWTLMADESVDRCYHSTALLLPDGRVLSAGGGEYAPNNPALPDQPNPPRDSHKNAQLFNPPYLFKRPRPVILNAPGVVFYGQTFDVICGAENTITKVSWVRLGSVTHSCNQNQSLIFLQYEQVNGAVTVHAPANSNIAPPGHYMLFVLNDEGVPSIARILRIEALGGTIRAEHDAVTPRIAPAAPEIVDLVALDRNIEANQGKSPVTVGVTPSCPYGIGACWGGAFDALQRLSNIEVVRPLPDTANSLAFVYLRRDALPDLGVWRNQFARIVNGTYIMRGIEMTLSGPVTEHLARLTLADTATGKDLVLAPLQAADKVQWDIRTRTNMPMSDEEASAFTRLFTRLAARPEEGEVRVTGPLKKHGVDFFLEVRSYAIVGT